MRDLTRAREEDMKGLLERMTKQRLNAFLLRYGRSYEGGKSPLDPGERSLEA